MLKLFRRGHNSRKDQASAYGRQRAALDAVHAQEGVDVFISPFDILRDNAGTELSYSTWPEGVLAWLPRTDCIGFTGKRGEARWFLIVRWEDVDTICPGALSPVPNLLPERMRTVRWPDVEQLEKLATVAVIKR